MIVLDFLLSIVLTVPFLATLLFLGILFEHNESRVWAIFIGIIATVVSYFYFKFPLIGVLYGAIAYSVVGVLWSFFRYKRYVNKKVDESRTMDDHEKQNLIRHIHPTLMLGAITAWIMIWPFSMVDNLLGDIVNAVEALVKTVFRSVYNRIYTSAVSQISGK